MCGPLRELGPNQHKISENKRKTGKVALTGLENKTPIFASTSAEAAPAERDGSSPHEDGEEIFPAGNRALLLPDDSGLPHEQEDLGRSGDHPFQAPTQQDRGLLDSPDEANPARPGARHLAQAPRRGERKAYGFRTRSVRH